MNDLDVERVRQRIRGRWGSSLTVLERTESTMDVASHAARAGAPDGHVVVADHQTRGRGAHGRSWLSPPGSDLYFSVVARPDVEPSSMALVTLAAGLGARDAAADLLPRRSVLVKWPNDLWIERRKCAGILVESRMVGPTVEAIIVGIGLNVNRVEWPSELRGLATSLALESNDETDFDRARVLGDVLFQVERQVENFVREGAQPLVHALRPHLALVGEEVRWEEGRGRFEGIDEGGAARVRTDGGLVSLVAAHLVPISQVG